MPESHSQGDNERNWGQGTTLGRQELEAALRGCLLPSGPLSLGTPRCPWWMGPEWIKQPSPIPRESRKFQALTKQSMSEEGQAHLGWVPLVLLPCCVTLGELASWQDLVSEPKRQVTMSCPLESNRHPHISSTTCTLRGRDRS